MFVDRIPVVYMLVRQKEKNYLDQRSATYPPKCLLAKDVNNPPDIQAGSTNNIPPLLLAALDKDFSP